MPTLTTAASNLEIDGPVIDLRFAVSARMETALQSIGSVVPGPLPVRAMIDTGATCTVIRHGLAQQLGLQPTGSILIHTPSDTNVRCYSYLVRLLFPMGVMFEKTVVEAPMRGQRLDCLVGRDVLASGVLVYLGPDNLFSLSF
jgi:predicted aspartyl protease